MPLAGWAAEQERLSKTPAAASHRSSARPGVDSRCPGTSSRRHVVSRIQKSLKGEFVRMRPLGLSGFEPTTRGNFSSTAGGLFETGS